MENQNLLSIKNYAQSCGITVQTIYGRIKKKEIQTEENGFIDILKYPFRPAAKRGRKTKQIEEIKEAESVS